MSEETKSAEEQKDQERKDAEDQEEKDIDKLMEEVEENPPDKLEDWPGGKAKYRTIGGTGDANEDWEDGPTAKLGPSDVVHHPDGSVSVKGEKVDNPEDYKGEPIPGGPTDPNAPADPSGLADDSDDSSFAEKAKTDEDALPGEGEKNA